MGSLYIINIQTINVPLQISSDIFSKIIQMHAIHKRNQ